MAFLDKLKSLSCLGNGSSRRRQDSDGNHHKSQSRASVASSTSTILPPLRPTKLPYVLPEHQEALSSQGWTTVTYFTPASSDPLFAASQFLLQASKTFFALPRSYKEGFVSKIGTEEGWTRVEGEKEFITLRNLEGTPEELKDAATAYWHEAGGLLNEILRKVAESLGLEADALTRFSEPCKDLGEQKTATLLRLFRYEGFAGDESKVVAQSHKDLGLLSLVVGDTPGLEVWDRHINRWFQIERSYDTPAASLLVGSQLERLSNERYMAGGHLVRSYPEARPPYAEPEKQYRYSIVFVLRTHGPVMVNTDDLTTSITGEFKEPIRDVKARQFFLDIQRSRFNINATHEEREQQRLKLLEKKSGQAQEAGAKSQSGIR